MKKIYLIDDDAAVRFLLKLQLNELGYEVFVFEEIAPFYEQIVRTNKLSNSILLLDVNLPNLRGDQFVVNHLKDFEKVEGLSIVLFGEKNNNNIQIETTDLDLEVFSKNDVVDYLKGKIALD